MKCEFTITKDEAEQIILKNVKEKFPKATIKFNKEHRSYSDDLGTVIVEFDLFEIEIEKQQELDLNATMEEVNTGE